jgi:hypothetical protein
MPPGECRASSWVLAACYPGLAYVEGHRTVTIATTEDPVSGKIEHAWNVNRTGEIVDSTLSPEIRSLVEAGRAELLYEPTDPASWWTTEIEDGALRTARAARSQVRGKSPRDKRKIVEAFGSMFATYPCDEDEA